MKFSKLLFALAIASYSFAYLHGMEQITENFAVMNLAGSSKKITLECGDDTLEDLELNVLYEQSKTFKMMIDDCGGINEAPAKVPLKNMSRSVMQFIYDCMLWINKQNFDHHKQAIFLTKKMLDGVFFERKIKLNRENILDLVFAANFLDIPILTNALCYIAAQNIKLVTHKKHKWTISNSRDFSKEIAHEITQKITGAYFDLYNESPFDTGLDKLSAFGLTQLGIFDSNVTPIFSQNFKVYIENCLNKHDFNGFEKILSPKVPRLLKKYAYEALINWTRKLPKGPNILQDLFKKIVDEGVVKMAVRLVYAERYKENIDELPCKNFVENKGFINVPGTKMYWGTSLLYKQTFLRYVLGLLEPFFKVGVKELNLNNRDLTELPLEICILDRLEKLYLSGNDLSTLPDEFATIQTIKLLDLGFNRFNEIPSVIGQLASLKDLNLDNNQLGTLSGKAISMLTRLKILHLGGNALTGLPDEIVSLKKLNRLSLCGNKLTDIPCAVFSLKKLHSLDIADNNIQQIPDIKKMWLYALYLDENVKVPDRILSCARSGESMFDLYWWDSHSNGFRRENKICYF